MPADLLQKSACHWVCHLIISFIYFLSHLKYKLLVLTLSGPVLSPASHLLLQNLSLRAPAQYFSFSKLVSSCSFLLPTCGKSFKENKKSIFWSLFKFPVPFENMQAAVTLRPPSWTVITPPCPVINATIQTHNQAAGSALWGRLQLLPEHNPIWK